MADKDVINKDELNEFVIEEDQNIIKGPDDFGDLDVTTRGVVDQFDFSGEEEFNIEVLNSKV